eukprot:TRINITY_DN345_c0_g2_i1.p1 TRINITY_DN345_c0_g2~~TRINITY_DN345_c0_g2_i1.p1  ORF type:complete len:468 (+),score=113.93 TRINITY_DN345_c0_g2_i1:112-1404(+)
MKTALLFSLALTISSIASSASGAGLYNAKSDVIQLNKNNFANLVFGSEHVWMVEFYAPWCGHCKSLAPEYDKAATNTKGLVRFGAINCDDEKELCGSFEVKGFPTLKFFPHTLTPVKGKKDSFNKVPVEYQQARTAPALVSFALSKLPNFVSNVATSSFEKFASKTDEKTGEVLPKVLLFTNKPKTTDLYKALAVDFHHRLDLAEVKHTDKELVDKYEITTFPTLVVVPSASDAAPVKYDGALKHEALSTFLSTFAKPLPKGGASSSSSPASEEKKPEDSGEVFEVTDASVLERRCSGACAVAVLDPDTSTPEGEAEHKRFLDVLTAVGKKHKGRMPVVWLNNQKHPNFATDLRLPSFYPNLIVYQQSKKRYFQSTGSFSEESIGEFFGNVLAGRMKRVVPLDSLPTLSVPAGSASATETKAASDKKDEL